jgi:hypothetical protein
MGVPVTERPGRSHDNGDADAMESARPSPFATVAMEAGLLEEIVGRLLNHTPLSITGQRYTRPSLDALRPAMETVCQELHRRMQ